MLSLHPQSAFQGSSGGCWGESAAVCVPNPQRPFAWHRKTIKTVTVASLQAKGGQGALQKRNCQNRHEGYPPLKLKIPFSEEIPPSAHAHAENAGQNTENSENVAY